MAAGSCPIAAGRASCISGSGRCPAATGRQLTTGLHDDDEPVFSPDGRLLAYRSEVNGGGIYLIPITSGPPRLFAQAGRRPRFSPDGRRIAYWVATNSRSSLFVGDVSGSQLPPFHAAFHSARDPVWSPDAKYVIFAGSRETSTDSWDWWGSSAEDGEPVATAAGRRFSRQHRTRPP